MLRAGLIRKTCGGYILISSAWTSHFAKRLKQIVREEMDNAGAQELLMSALLPAEAYQASADGKCSDRVCSK